jgi:hypothetical protein
MKRTGRNAILLDANILLLMVIGSCDRELIPRFGRTSQAFTPEDYDLLQAILTKADVIVATPSILTEVSNLCRGIGKGVRIQARLALAQVIRLTDERHVPSAEVVEDPSFTRLGLTDAAIARIAANDLRVLTIDHALHYELARRGIDVVNFNHLRL